MPVNQLASEVSQRFRKGVSWSVAGGLVASLVNFSLGVCIARIIGKQEFGEFAIISNTLTAVAGVAQLAVGYTTTKYLSEYRSVDKCKAGRIIGFCAIVANATALFGTVFVIAGADWLTVAMLGQPQLRAKLLFSSGLVFFTVLNGFQTGILAGLERYQDLAKTTALAAICNIMVCVAAVLIGGQMGAVISLPIGACIQWILFRRVVAKAIDDEKIKIIYEGAHQERRIFTRFTLPAAASGFFALPVLWLANSFLVQQKDGVSQMAIFAAANTLRTIVTIVPTILNKVTMSMMNHERGRTNHSSYRSIFKLNLFSGALLATVAALGLATVGPYLLGTYGASFRSGYGVLTVLLAVAVLEVVCQCIYQLVQSSEKLWHSLFLVVIPRDLTIAIIAWLYVPTMGAMGLAVSYAIGWSLALIAVIGISIKNDLFTNLTHANCRKT